MRYYNRNNGARWRVALALLACVLLPGCSGSAATAVQKNWKGQIIMAERYLPMTGGFNYRDLGGIAAGDGRRVVWGSFFRADDMSGLIREDLDYLNNIPIITVVDFRTRKEAEAAPDRLPASVVNSVPLRISPGNLSLDNLEDIRSAEEAEAILTDLYRNMVTDKEVIARYREFFRIIQNEDYLPVLYHCSAGKDRTGLAAALFLSALGVEREAVMEDYLASNSRLAAKYRHIVSKSPHLEPAFTVKAEYLEAAFDEIKNRYGSVEAYLAEELEADLDTLRGKYLY